MGVLTKTIEPGLRARLKFCKKHFPKEYVADCILNYELYQKVIETVNKSNFNNLVIPSNE